MSSDLTASISTRLNGTLAPLDQAAGKVKVLRDRLVEANRAGVDASTSIGRVFGRAAAPVGREPVSYTHLDVYKRQPRIHRRRRRPRHRP